MSANDFTFAAISIFVIAIVIALVRDIGRYRRGEKLTDLEQSDFTTY